MFAREFLTGIRMEIVENIKREIFKNFRRDTVQSYECVMEKIRRELAYTLEKRGIDISNMEIDLKPDNSNVRVCIKGE